MNQIILCVYFTKSKKKGGGLEVSVVAIKVSETHYTKSLQEFPEWQILFKKGVKYHVTRNYHNHLSES